MLEIKNCFYNYMYRINLQPILTVTMNCIRLISHFLNFILCRNLSSGSFASISHSRYWFRSKYYFLWREIPIYILRYKLRKFRIHNKFYYLVDTYANQSDWQLWRNITKNCAVQNTDIFLLSSGMQIYFVGNP